MSRRRLEAGLPQGTRKAPLRAASITDLTRFTKIPLLKDPTNTPRARRFHSGKSGLGWEFSPLKVDLGYRAPRTPHLARSARQPYQPLCRVPSATPGGVRERPNRHAWKACERKLRGFESHPLRQIQIERSPSKHRLLLSATPANGLFRDTIFGREDF